MTEVPCNLVEGLTDAQRRAYILADNKLAELAAWDEAMAGLELEELEELGFDLALTGFTPEDIQIGEGEAPEETGDSESTKLRKRYTCPQCGYEFNAK